RASPERTTRRTAETSAPEEDVEPGEDAPAEIRGVVVDQDDQPIDGAEVTLSHVDASGRERARQPLIDRGRLVPPVRTGADGRFSFGAHERESVVVVATKDGYVPRGALF